MLIFSLFGSVSYGGCAFISLYLVCFIWLYCIYYIVLYLESVSLNLDGDFDEGDFEDVVLCGDV